MKNRTNKRRIYERYQSRLNLRSVPLKKRYKLNDLLAEMPEASHLGEGWREVWGDIVPVGREFGSEDYERSAKRDLSANALKSRRPTSI